MSIKIRLAALTMAAGMAITGAVGLGADAASAASQAPQLAPSSSPWSLQAKTVTPTVNGLRIRSGPSTGYGAYGLLYRGDHMKVTTVERRGSAGYWCHVRLTRRSASGLRSGHTGWVYAPYLRHV